MPSQRDPRSPRLRWWRRGSGLPNQWSFFRALKRKPLQIGVSSFQWFGSKLKPPTPVSITEKEDHMNGYKFLLRLCVVLGIVRFSLIPMMVCAADIHNTTVIVLDGSGSMNDSMTDQRTGESVKKMDAAKKALKDVLRKV